MLNLNPHLHVLMLDGVYVAADDGTPSFIPAPRLTDEDVRQIVETTARRVIRLCQRRGPAATRAEATESTRQTTDDAP